MASMDKKEVSALWMMILVMMKTRQIMAEMTNSKKRKLTALAESALVAGWS